MKKKLEGEIEKCEQKKTSADMTEAFLPFSERQGLALKKTSTDVGPFSDPQPSVSKCIDPGPVLLCLMQQKLLYYFNQPKTSCSKAQSHFIKQTCLCCCG